MGQLIHLLRLNLSPETGKFLRSLDWPDDSMIAGVSFHVTDGTSVRLGRDFAIEVKRCLDAAAKSAEDGHAAFPVSAVECADEADSRAKEDHERLLQLVESKIGASP